MIVKLLDDHKYEVTLPNGTVVMPISVTQIMEEVKLVDTQWFTEESRIRGTHVHKICEYHDQRDLDESSVSDEYKTYYESYKKFLKDYDVKWDFIEQRFYNLALDYSGTLDRGGLVNGTDCIVDIKTGGLYPSYGFQLAGYALGINKPNAMRYCLGLNGKKVGYEFKKYGSTEHDRAFLNAINLIKYKRGLKK